MNSKGEIIQITDKSGHYEPDATMVLKGLAALKQQGVKSEQDRADHECPPRRELAVARLQR